jgi:hypothetical protein
MGSIADDRAASARADAGRHRSQGRHDAAARAEAEALKYERKSLDEAARERDRDNQRHLEQVMRREREAARRDAEKQRQQDEDREERRRLHERRMEEQRQEREAQRQAAEEDAAQAEMDIIDLIAAARSRLSKLPDGDAREIERGVCKATLDCLEARQLWDEYSISDAQSRRDLHDVEQQIDELTRQHRLADFSTVAPMCLSLMTLSSEVPLRGAQKALDAAKAARPTGAYEGLEELHATAKHAADVLEESLRALAPIVAEARSIGILSSEPGNELEFSAAPRMFFECYTSSGEVPSKSTHFMEAMALADDKKSGAELVGGIRAQIDAWWSSTVGAERHRLLDAMKELDYYRPAIETLLQAAPIKFSDWDRAPELEGKLTNQLQDSWSKIYYRCQMTFVGSMALTLLLAAFKSAPPWLQAIPCVVVLLMVFALPVFMIGHRNRRKAVMERAQRLAAKSQA